MTMQKILSNSNTLTLKHFYDKEKKRFYIKNAKCIDCDNAVEITAKQHAKLINAINKGCIIFDDLSYSKPKPSIFHTWDGKQWIENEDAKYQSLVPTSITKRQLMLQLNKMKLYEPLLSFINQAYNVELKIEFEYSFQFELSSNFIKALVIIFSLDDHQINNLFVEACKL